MKTQWYLRKFRQTLTVAAVLALGGTGAARAATGHSAAYGLINWLWSDKYEATELYTVTHENLIWANYDTQYNLTGMHNWESVTWITREAGQRRPASLLGTDWSTTPIEGRYIQLRNLTVDHTDLDAQNVLLRFFPVTGTGGSSLTLQDGSLAALNPPGFNSNEPFTLAASGDSTLSNWGKGRVSSQTTLNVTPGSKLTFFRLGQFAGGTFATDSWYFSHPGNVATIDGGTLKLDQSFVTFGQSVFIPGEELGRMTFQNNALLDIVGEGGRLDSGNFFFLDSRLNLGSANRLKAADTVTLNGATVTTDESSKLDTAALDVYGSNSIALGKETRTGDYIVTTGAMVVNPDALLTLNSPDGRGSLAVTFQLRYGPTGPGQQQGQIVIDDNANLVNSGALFDIPPDAPITINRSSDALFGFLYVKGGGSLNLGASAGNPGRVTNHGQIGVDTDGILVALGPNVIQGGSEGRIGIGDDGVLMLGNTGTAAAAAVSLTTENTVSLENFSKLDITLDPTALKNGQLRAGSTLYIEEFADLRLAVVNDAVLPVDTKFSLINYASLITSQAGQGFNGYPEGHIFSLGLNAYRINYADTADAGNTKAITLTVVDQPALSPSVQQVAGIANSPLTPTSALTPLNFEPGCGLVYTTPSLPPNLSLDPGTGVISGTPTSAQAAANIIITGTITGGGLCTGQSAQATVTLTIAATQTITFGAAPTPTFAPNGTFVVNATATSGEPVVYSSQTPTVCTTNGNSTITMLGAGLCTIAANQPGNANWAPAPQMTQNITIAPGTQAALVLSASPASVAVNGTSLLQATGGSGGGLVTYHQVSGPCSLGAATLTGTATGSCVFNATKAADSDFAARTSNDVTVVVTAIPLTVSYPANLLTIGTPVALPPTVSGATGPLTYSLVSGPLPSGLALDPATGVISGTPTGAAGAFPVAIRVTDGTGTFIASLTLTVQAPTLPIPTLSEWGMLILACLILLAAGWRSPRTGPRRQSGV